MRILYVHRTQGKGAEAAHILGMYEAFRDAGHEVRMLCLPGCDPSQNTPQTKADSGSSSTEKGWLGKTYGLITESLPQWLFEMAELAYNLPLAFRFCLFKWRWNPELVYERYALNTLATVTLCRLFGIPHVLEVNDSVSIERSRPLSLRWISRIFERLALTWTRLSVTITDDFRTKLLKTFSLPESKIVVLTNAVSRRRFKGPFDRESLRKRLQCRGHILIGSTGQFLPWHGLEELVSYLGPKAETLDIGFLFIGDGPSRETVMAKAKELGISERVVFTGMIPVSEVPRHLALLDIAVIPRAARHASPMKLMEFMAMGLPIVAPEMESIQAAVKNGDTGWLFPADDFNRMRELTESLIQTESERLKLGSKAREFVFENLTWDGHAAIVMQKLGLN